MFYEIEVRYDEKKAKKIIVDLDAKYEHNLKKFMNKTGRLVELIDKRLLRNIGFKKAVVYSLSEFGFDRDWWIIYHRFAMIYYANHRSKKENRIVDSIDVAKEVHEELKAHRKVMEKIRKKRTDCLQLYLFV